MGNLSNQSAVGSAASAAPTSATSSAAPSTPPVPAPAARRPLVGAATGGRPPGAAAPGRPVANAEPGTQASQASNNAQRALQQMMVQQQAMSLLGVQAQTFAAETNMRGQQIGALAETTVQAFTDQARSAKDGMKSQGDAFAKAT